MTSSFSSSTVSACAEAASSRKLTIAELDNYQQERLFHAVRSIKAYRVRQKLAQSKRLLQSFQSMLPLFNPFSTKFAENQ